MRVVGGLQGEAPVADAAAVALLLVHLHDVLQVLLPPAEGELLTARRSRHHPASHPPAEDGPAEHRGAPAARKGTPLKCRVGASTGGGRQLTCPPDQPTPGPSPAPPHLTFALSPTPAGPDGGLARGRDGHTAANTHARHGTRAGQGASSPFPSSEA